VVGFDWVDLGPEDSVRPQRIVLTLLRFLTEGRMRLLSAFALCAALVPSQSALAFGQEQEAVVYSFGTNPNDGRIPNGGLVFDNAGNLYGTTQYGGLSGGGTVFELTPGANDTWTESILYNFCSQPNCADGQVPEAGLIFDSSRNLYGTTIAGGMFDGGTCRAGGCGTVFELSPPSSPGGNWIETVLWNFQGNLNNDGDAPWGRLAWDAAGNLYGTTEGGGTSLSLGTVFELSPISREAWSESVLYRFCANGPPCTDGVYPLAGVSFDLSGNLFGTTSYPAGTVFELSPQAGEWAETTLHHFTAYGGDDPISEVNIDQTTGNLYGTVSGGQGEARCGGVWRLTPQSDSTYQGGVLLLNQSGANGCTPLASVFHESQSNVLFATASTGGSNNAGTLYKISSAGKQTVLYDFCQQASCADGSMPSASLTKHAGALFGTTSAGGSYNQGVVFRIWY
jgi:uncharacterized repeat protein (TIGR03803 family)